MQPQVLVGIVLFSLILLFKLCVMAFSKTYDSIRVLNEIPVLMITIALNMFALYGLDCSVKGGCTVFAWVLVAILMILFFWNVLFDIYIFKKWQAFKQFCNKEKGEITYSANSDDILCKFSNNNTTSFFKDILHLYDM
jgi:hypothetical protein